MNHYNIQNELYEYAKTLPVIDGHEHFINEELHITRYLSFFNYLSPYARRDIVIAGADEARMKHPENEAEAFALFAYIKPFWQFIRNGSYAQPIFRAVERFHGCDDLTEESIVKIGRELNARNKPGHYDEVFNECKIEKILNLTIGCPAFSDHRFVRGIQKEADYGERIREFFAAYPNGKLDDYYEYMDSEMAKEVALGAKMQKFFADVFLARPDEGAARENFEKMRSSPGERCGPVLAATIAHKKLHLTAKHGIVAPVHAGVWSNINRQSPAVIFPVLDAFWGSGVWFDIFHMGIPFVRECAFLAKNYPFVSLNMCWSYCVSEHMAMNTISEWLDLVPVNRIIGFGGDVDTLPEHIWGQLDHARRCLSKALARRISAGRMDMDYAKFVMRLWFYENPKQIYKL